MIYLPYKQISSVFVPKTYHCEWNNCGFIGLTTTRMGQHLRQHGREEECKWAQCNGFQRTSYEDLELHIIHDHFFDVWCKNFFVMFNFFACL